jgi:hypothetical protein
MKVPVGTCAICGDPIWMEVRDRFSNNIVDLEQEFNTLAEQHLRSHPEPEQARFWLRRFLEDVRPGERAVAVKRIYSELRALWGDQDCRSAYTVEEALGSVSLYRLWLAANRCSYAECTHTEVRSRAGSRDAAAGSVAWHRQLLGRILPPPRWKGTSREWRELSSAVTRYCTCPSTAMQSVVCPAHRMLADPNSYKRLLFGRRMARRLEREEFDDSGQTFTRAPGPADAIQQ